MWWALKRKVHFCWLIAFLSAGFSLGIYLVQFINSLPISSGFLIISALLFVSISFWRQNYLIIILIVVGGFMLGLWRGEILKTESIGLSKYFNQEITLTGVINDDVEDGTGDKKIIKVSEVAIDDNKINGLIRATINNDQISRGDQVTISGKITKGSGVISGFIYEAKLVNLSKNKNRNYIVEIRDWFIGGVKKSIHSPESSLGIGYVVGQKQELPQDLVLALQAAGLTHIVVASGYNLTILVRLARRLFVKISKYLSVISAFSMIVIFILITGLSPSMLRAGLVSGLCLLAWYYGRRFHPIILFLFVMAITLLINPGYAWGDIGWQLSFLAFFGVMILAPLMQHYFFENKKINFVGQILIETISAQAMTLPVIVMAFGQISNVSIITNLLILPFVPLAMLLTFVAGVFGTILPSVAVIIGMPASLLLSAMIAISKFFADLPWAVSVMKGSVQLFVIYFLIVFLFIVYLWRKTGYNLRSSNLVE